MARVDGAKGEKLKDEAREVGESRSYSVAAFTMKNHGTVVRLLCDLIFERFLRLLEKTEGRRAKGWRGGRVGDQVEGQRPQLLHVRNAGGRKQRWW